jgi:NAD kinase
VTLATRAVVVCRRTEFEELLDRHGTRQQAEFFLGTRGRSMEDVEERDRRSQEALAAVASAIPFDWRRGRVERADLDRFLFEPEDVVVVVGQDGLVANVAKYLSGQPVVGIDPEPGRNPGVLVPHSPDAARELLALAASSAVADHVQKRAMVQARTDDGQELRALNEIFVGHASHQSARYRIRLPGGNVERQSSSGLLVGTGTGSTGWCRSAWLERGSSLALPEPEDGSLIWFVREAWPSPATGTSLTQGLLPPGDELVIEAESDRLVIFGDGIENDRVSLTWGQSVALRLAGPRLNLVVV